MRKTVLYLGLQYHKKTKSNLFLLDLLKEKYIVDVYYYDMWLEIIDSEDLYKILNKEYDYLVCWQVRPTDFILNKLKYKKGIYFPMYDDVFNLSVSEWDRFSNFIIINFSKSVHKYLLSRGFCTKYIQYFPPKQKVENWGRDDSLFFWQRLTMVDINFTLKLCRDLKIERIHIHKALDPGCIFTNIERENNYNIEYSYWFERKEDMLEQMAQSSLYMAPRLREGIGMSFLEAMAMGRCVIAPNYPTMNEYIVNGETGILYDYENPNLASEYNIKRIQKNVYEYMTEGNLKWEKGKYQIFEWMEDANVTFRDKENNKLKTITENNSEKKYKCYFRILDRWLMLKNRGVLLVDFFLDNKIEKIVIYGGGEVACRLIEELEETSVEIIGIIDKNRNQVRAHLPVFKPTDKLPEIDAIIVTPIYSFLEIYIQLIQTVKCRIISLSKVIDSCLTMEDEKV